MRKPLVAGNWKMNLNLKQGRELVSDILRRLPADALERADVAVCPPAIYLFPLMRTIDTQPLRLGAQNVYFDDSGAFTGEVSAGMVADTGAKYIIVGHSERRHTIGHLEDDRMINLKVKAVRRAGLTPILCVGETLGEREAGQTSDVLTFQLAAGVHGLSVTSAHDLVLAYEPVWAIGTGRNATPEQAQEAHAHLRGELRRLIGPAAEHVRILYGGSLKPDNAAAILANPDVDGGLVGGASLRAESFVAIVAAALVRAQGTDYH
jgi:triosephosphate isomerase